MALLAYEEPEKSPMFDLLEDVYRERVAELLNGALLGEQLSGYQTQKTRELPSQKRTRQGENVEERGKCSKRF